MQKPDNDLNLDAARCAVEALRPFFVALCEVLDTLAKIPWPVALRHLEEVRSIELSQALGVPPRTVWTADGVSTGPDRQRTFTEGLDEIRTRNADVAKLLGLPECTPWMQLLTELHRRVK